MHAESWQSVFFIDSDVSSSSSSLHLALYLQARSTRDPGQKAVVHVAWQKLDYLHPKGNAKTQKQQTELTDEFIFIHEIPDSA